MSDKSKRVHKVNEPVELKATEYAKRLKYVYEYVAELDKELHPDTYKTVQRYKLADTYSPEKIEQVIDTALKDPKTSKQWRFTETTLKAFQANINEVMAFFDKFRANGELVIEKFSVVPSDPSYAVYFDEKPTTKLIKPEKPSPAIRLLSHTSKPTSDEPIEPIEVTEYAVKDLDGLVGAIRQAEHKTLILYGLELPQDVQLVKKTVEKAIKQNDPDLLQNLPNADRYIEKLAQTLKLTPYGKSEVWTHFDTYLLKGELGGLIALTGVTDDIAGNAEIANAPTQTELFSNMIIGLDTNEITGRHQFFSPMFRGFMNLGEQGLFNAVERANRGSKTVTIPYDTKGTTSVYRTKMQTEIELSGHSKQIIRTSTEAERFMARLIKAQGVLYLYAMHTHSMTIYNAKVTDMLRLAGYEGRIKQEHYTDITEGIAGLFAITLTKTDNYYTDPKTGKRIPVGKNELYGEVIRPIGDLQAIWHTDKDNNPLYIKKIIRLQIAEGMLNPNQRRATLISKALLKLNTLQERQYIQLGSFVSDHFSQYQDQTVEGKPIRLTLQTLLEWRGLADSDNLRRIDRTKSQLKNTLDKLVDIGHIAKWEIEGAKYDKLGLSPDDRSKIALLYPAPAIIEALRPKLADPDDKLKKILKQQVKESGAGKIAEQYGTTTEAIQSILNNRETVDSLPLKAYNELKAKAYDKQNAK